MNIRRFACCLLLSWMPLAWPALPVAVDGQTLPSLAPMLEKITGAVVNVATTTHRRLPHHPLLEDPFFRWFFEGVPQERRPEAQSLGSGIIVDATRGYVLTNNHVIDGADEIKVTLKDGRSFHARLLGKDPDMDIAVLKIPAEHLTALHWADSDKLRVGDFVVAIGSPFGLNQTVTSGIVSALGRSGLGIEGYENFIQTDASINPGNSGGPLVNLRGELVGINTAILAPNGGNVGIGFAIPANIAHNIMQQIIAYGGVQRGTFGATFQDLSADLAQALGMARPRGAVVAAVEPGSAADKAGLRIGDVILRIGRHQIHGASDLHTQLGLSRIGEPLALEILRNGKQITLHAAVADPYADYVPGKSIHPLLAGALLGEVVDVSGLGENPGIAVGRIRQDSPAWRSGLRKDDVIFKINGHRAATLQQLAHILARSQGIWQLQLRRGDSLLTLSSH
jgi:Do/DeqQ family serine protease